MNVNPLKRIYNLFKKNKDQDIRVINFNYSQDGLYTNHCADFMNDDYFLKAYSAGEATNSWCGANIHWRVYIACWLAERATHINGDFIECGVNRGGISRSILSYLGNGFKDRCFYLLDTYCGIPSSILSEHELQHDKVFKNYYTECYEAVRETFKQFPEVVIIRGLVPDSFRYVDSNNFSFVHIDMNNAKSEISAAEYLWPRLSTGGYMLLDDYGWEICIEQRLAFNKFAKKHGMTVLALPTGQGLLIKS